VTPNEIPCQRTGDLGREGRLALGPFPFLRGVAEPQPGGRPDSHGFALEPCPQLRDSAGLLPASPLSPPIRGIGRQSCRLFGCVLRLIIPVLAKEAIRKSGLDVDNASILDSDRLSRDQFAAFVIQSVFVPSIFVPSNSNPATRPSNSNLTSAHQGDTLSINSRS